MAAARILKRCGALQYILFFFWKRVWVTAATEECLAKQDAMAGLDEAVDTPTKDPKVTELEQEVSKQEATNNRMQEFLKAGTRWAARGSQRALKLSSGATLAEKVSQGRISLQLEIFVTTF